MVAVFFSYLSSHMYISVQISISMHVSVRAHTCVKVITYSDGHHILYTAVYVLQNYTCCLLVAQTLPYRVTTTLKSCMI